MRPLRIAMLTHSTNPRGGVVHALELANALHDQGQDVTLMATAPGEQRFFRESRCRNRLIPITDTTQSRYAPNAGWAGSICPPQAFPLSPRERGRGEGQERLVLATNSLKHQPPGPHPKSLSRRERDLPRTLADQIARRIQAIIDHFSRPDCERYDFYHAQDAISGCALAKLTERGVIDGFIRTVHHLDHIDDPDLAAWQQRSYREARQVLCVSRTWQDKLAAEYGIAAIAVNNGVDTGRFSPDPQPGDEALRQRLGLNRSGPVFLAVGGIEARKNTLRIFQAFTRVLRTYSADPHQSAENAIIKRLGHHPIPSSFHSGAESSPSPCGRGVGVRAPAPHAGNESVETPSTSALTLPSPRGRGFQSSTAPELNRLTNAQLVIAGGASLLDHSAYRREFDRAVAESGIPAGPGQPLVLAGPLADADMPALFRLADTLVFPSLQEGFGLVALEALVSGTPVVVSHRPPFTEYLEKSDCQWADPEDCDSIAAAMVAAATAFPADRLPAIARRLSERYSWATSARAHLNLYRTLTTPGELSHA